MSSVGACVSCGRVREVDGRGLCKTQCQVKVSKQRGNPDADYMMWLLNARDPSRIVMPHDLLAPMIEGGVEKYGSLTELAEISGVSSRRLHETRKGKNGSYKMGCGLARALGCLDEFEARACEIGREGWSDVGTYCGEGSGVLVGCGTYFHKHYGDGLCEECWFREVLGQGPSEPRDIRLIRRSGRVNVG